MEKPVLVYDVNEKPSVGRWILLSLQHVLAMFGATVLVPMITGLSPAVTLVSAGIGTLTYIFITKGKSPVFLGSSFAYIAPISSALALGVAVGEKNYGAVTIGLVIVGLVYLSIALLIKYLGTNWINKLLPPIVIGPVIMVIGLGLANVAVGMISNNGGQFSDLGNANLRFLAVSGITLFTAVLVANYSKGLTKLIPVMIGIIVGYIAAIIFGLVPLSPVFDPNKFSYLEWIKLPTAVINESKDSWLGLFKIPDFSFLKGNLFSNINFSRIIEIMALFIPVALVTISEHIGDHLVLGSIIGKDLTKNPGLSKTLAGDGLATLFAGVIGGPANTTYGENTGVIGITKVASVWVIGTAAIIAFLLGFVAPFTALISTIPACVMGGVSMMLFGIIASSGVRLLINNRIDFSKERNLLTAAIILVSGIGGLAISLNIGNLSMTLSPMAVAAIIGIVLHQILPDKLAGYGENYTIVKDTTVNGEK